MKLPLIAAVFALAAVLPRPAAAQCNGGCTTFRKMNGEIAGYGCMIEQNSGRSCVATTSRCTLSLCANALLTTPEGRFVGRSDGCAEDGLVSSTHEGHEPVFAAFAARVRLLVLRQRLIAED